MLSRSYSQTMYSGTFWIPLVPIHPGATTEGISQPGLRKTRWISPRTTPSRSVSNTMTPGRDWITFSAGTVPAVTLTGSGQLAEAQFRLPPDSQATPEKGNPTAYGLPHS